MTNREKIEKQIDEAFYLLREKPINSTFTERWFLLQDCYEEVKDLPRSLGQSRGLAYILERASLPIKEYDLLLGRYIDKIPTEEEEKRFWDYINTNPSPIHPVTMGNGGHNTMDWDTLTKIGITGYLKKAEKLLSEIESDPDAEPGLLLFRQGMVEVYRAIMRYIERYADAARDAGMTDCERTCRELLLHEPHTLREALQLVLFVFTVYMIYAGFPVACLCLGRMDEYLLPLYQSDIEKGILTREEAGYLIDDFNCKTNLHLGRGEHQMGHLSSGQGDGNTTGWERNHTYDSPTYIVLGGRSNQYDHTSNPLTLLLAEHITPGFKNPVYVYRWSNDRPDDVWDVICKRIRENATILVYNDETMIAAMEHAGVEHKDAVNYTIHACNWPDVDGYVNVDLPGIPIPKMVMNALVSDGKLIKEYESIDEIYKAIEDNYRVVLKERFDAYRERFVYGNHPHADCLTLNDCFMRGTIESGRSMFFGGVKYPGMYNLVRSVGTAADIMAAIDKAVYKEKKYTLPQIVAALNDNFEGHTEMLAYMKNAPKYGTDNDEADSHAVRLIKTMLDVVDEQAVNERGERDVLSLNVTITDMGHLGEGLTLMATPDGRLSGAPISENLSPTVGYFDSITALLNSVSKLPFDRLHSGALNLRFRRDIVSGDDGLDRLKFLMDTYMKMGGMQFQISIADTEDLKKAQITPENYKDLTVRITGYSAIFIDMAKKAQDEIIRREELSK